jgi:hypothetical protein
VLPDNTALPPQKTKRPAARAWTSAAAVVWLAAVGSGLWVLWAYDNRAGVSADAPGRWPAATTLKRSADRHTLLFVAHPQCTCTRASLEELAEILARASSHQPRTYVLFLKPSSVDAGWEQTDLWTRAATLPNVTVLRDDDGVEARRFGVETSGQTLLYDDAGTLVYSGGITGSRGHAGENAGELALLTLLTRGQGEHRSASVFGCSLFSRVDQRF